MLTKIHKSVLAGLIIALSGWMYLSVSNPIIGAFLFSCGLLAVRIYNLNLFTGKIQYMITREYKWYDYIIFLVGNFIGVTLITVISRNLVINAADSISIIKASQSFGDALIKGVGCGILMSLATCKKSPLWMCILCVMGFILAGFNHCIADYYYLSITHSFTWSFSATILGNIIGGIIFSNLSVQDEQ